MKNKIINYPQLHVQAEKMTGKYLVIQLVKNLIKITLASCKVVKL